MSDSLSLVEQLKKIKIEQEKLNNFYKLSELFNDDLEDLAIAIILINKMINRKKKENTGVKTRKTYQSKSFKIETNKTSIEIILIS